MNIQQIIETSESIRVGSSGIDGASYYLLIPLAMGIVFALIILLIKISEREKNSEKSFFKKITQTFSLIFMASFVYYLFYEVTNLPTLEQQEQLVEDKEKWKVDTAIPYINSLPIERTTLQKVEYSHELSKKEGNNWKKIVSEELVPLELFYENGAREQKWVKLEIAPTLQETFVQKQVLQDDIWFTPSNELITPYLDSLWDEKVFDRGNYNETVYIKEPFKK